MIDSHTRWISSRGPANLFDEFERDWQRFVTGPATEHSLRGWQRNEPALGAFSDLDALLDAMAVTRDVQRLRHPDEELAQLWPSTCASLVYCLLCVGLPLKALHQVMVTVGRIDGTAPGDAGQFPVVQQSRLWLP